MFSRSFANAALKMALWLLFTNSFACAQETELDPVKWSLQIKTSAVSLKAGDRFVVQLTAQIENGWRLYSTEQVEGGPKPTRITFPAGQPFEKAGEIELALTGKAAVMTAPLQNVHGEPRRIGELQEK